MYPDNASPTVTSAAAFMLMATAASEHRSVATIDVTGAYLKADIGERDVHMTLEPAIAKIIVKLAPSYAPYIRNNGTVIVQLDRALYGLVESAKLWYQNLSSTLNSLGFKANQRDPCVFNRGTGNERCSLCFHVDDLLVTAITTAELDRVCEQLRGRYQTITTHRGANHSYLGMSLSFSKAGTVSVTMEGYTQERHCHYASPARFIRH